MMLYYRCKCGNIFNGHWNKVSFGDIYSKYRRAMICPMCGNEDEKKNIESDEDYPTKGEEYA